ncbi:MAG TPA: tetratricopeptide repeat protein, partial [Blastocatellia bacterium]|nr:tetratricopeptide repeat protein [Blastocatellia bacterium]
EVWREIGGTYQAVSMWEDARSALERFIERRPFDAEGLYRMANVASKLNQPEQSREMLERCIEAVKTMPYYRRGDVRKWGKLAEKDLGSRI